MANTILLKKTAVENKAPVVGDLGYGELAINYHDGNIYFKNTSDQISEFKRLDERLNATNVTNMTYNVDGDLEEVTYSTGNVVKLYYDVDGDLDYAEYYAVNGTTHLFTQSLTYDGSKNLTGTTWSAA